MEDMVWINYIDVADAHTRVPSHVRTKTSQGRNRRDKITNERREEINRRQREYQRDRRARMIEEETEESKRKQREIVADK